MSVSKRSASFQVLPTPPGNNGSPEKITVGSSPMGTYTSATDPGVLPRNAITSSSIPGNCALSPWRRCTFAATPVADSIAWASGAPADVGTWVRCTISGRARIWSQCSCVVINDTKSRSQGVSSAADSSNSIMASGSSAASISTCEPVVFDVMTYTLLSISETERVRMVTCGKSYKTLMGPSVGDVLDMTANLHVQANCCE